MDGHTSLAPSATVLQFPAGGRPALARAARYASVQNENRQPPRIVYDNWYHEEAVRADDDHGA